MSLNWIEGQRGTSLKFAPLLQGNIPRYADFIESLRRGTGEALYDSERTLLLYETKGDCYFLTSEDAREGQEVLNRFADQIHMLVVRGEALAAHARVLGFGDEFPCWQVVYTSTAPLPVADGLEIRHPGAEDFPTVRAHYDLVDEETLWEDFSAPDFLAAYLNGKMVGFIGLHAEGAMGILEIFPDYRRRGYAQSLYSSLINRQIALERLPYAHVRQENANSIALQRKLGLTFSDCLLYWMIGKK